ncbi:uncharacterized mitochondrial protein AtMg00810-like [Gastrolobium bilobum]|uniref:uncharacterized mitochondrial protein AtMg00810-like n=1 Tax=Gastrolobium bilobum TaxID=150636 RepID=UPI002AB3276E|nr:uncharacterized mitochondrial protein AtMg00810-like [Gastrolobium bilobum]
MDLLTESGLLGCKPASSPMAQNHKLALAAGPTYDDLARYRRLIGKLVYLTITRPDLSYAVHTLSQFMQNPQQQHFDAVIRVLRYVKQNSGQGLFMSSGSSLSIRAFCDSDWASCPVTKRSTTDYFILLGDSPISWKTKKQVKITWVV